MLTWNLYGKISGPITGMLLHVTSTLQPDRHLTTQATATKISTAVC